MIPWNRFEVYFHKIPFSPISTINFSSDLIKFEEYVKEFLNSLWIRPIFTIIPLNSSEFPKIGKFGIIFDAIPLAIDDLAVSFRQRGQWPDGARAEAGQRPDDKTTAWQWDDDTLVRQQRGARTVARLRDDGAAVGRQRGEGATVRCSDDNGSGRGGGGGVCGSGGNIVKKARGGGGGGTCACSSSGGGDDGGWTSSSTFLEQSLKREFSPFLVKMTARVWGGGSLPTL